MTTLLQPGQQAVRLKHDHLATAWQASRMTTLLQPGQQAVRLMHDHRHLLHDPTQVLNAQRCAPAEQLLKPPRRHAHLPHVPAAPGRRPHPLAAHAAQVHL